MQQYNLLIKSAQHVSGNFCPSSGAQDRDYCMWCSPQIVVGRRPSHRTHSPCRHTAGLRPTTIWGHYTTCSNHGLALPRMGTELPEICWADLKINKLLLLHLVGPLRHLSRLVHGQTHIKIKRGVFKILNTAGELSLGRNNQTCWCIRLVLPGV